MHKDIKFYLIVGLLAIVFVLGIKAGERHAIRHQHIKQVNTGYTITLDGQKYYYEG